MKSYYSWASCRLARPEQSSPFSPPILIPAVGHQKACKERHIGCKSHVSLSSRWWTALVLYNKDKRLELLLDFLWRAYHYPHLPQITKRSPCTAQDLYTEEQPRHLSKHAAPFLESALSYQNGVQVHPSHSSSFITKPLTFKDRESQIQDKILKLGPVKPHLKRVLPASSNFTFSRLSIFRTNLLRNLNGFWRSGWGTGIIGPREVEGPKENIFSPNTNHCLYSPWVLGLICIWIPDRALQDA